MAQIKISELPVTEIGSGTVPIVQDGETKKYDLAGKLESTGGQMSGTLSFTPSLWLQNDAPAMDLNNGDIVNFNGLYAADAATGLSEGINWKNADGQDPQTWDSIWARGGKFYFAPASGAAKEIAHAGNMLDLMYYPNGTYSQRATIIGYTGGANGTVYIFPDFPRPLPPGKTINLTALTSVTLRAGGKIMANDVTLTSNIDTAIRFYNGKFNIKLTGVTTNWSTDQVVFGLGTFAFTIS